MDTPMNSGYGESAARESGTTSGGTNAGLEQFLRKLGINEETINNIRSSIQNANLEEYLDNARDLLRSNAEKAKDFAKENPGKVAAGAVLVAVGIGLLINASRKS